MNLVLQNLGKRCKKIENAILNYRRNYDVILVVS